MKKHLLPVFILGFCCTTPAFAYVGPGVGLGVIGTLFGIFAAIALALFGLFWYPLKRAFGKTSATAGDQKDTAADDATGGNNSQ